MDLNAIRQEDVELNHLAEGWDKMWALLNTATESRIDQKMYFLYVHFFGCDRQHQVLPLVNHFVYC